MALGYTTLGKGAEKVIVLHSWMHDHTVWQPTFAALDTQTFTYVFPDYRGYGKSRYGTGQYTMQEIAADLLALIQRLGWRQFHIIGHSMGAMVMQRVLVDINDHQRIKSAIAITPIPACGAQLDENSWATFEASISDTASRHMIMDFTTGKRLPDAWLNQMVKHSFATTTPDAFAGYLRAWVYEDFSNLVMDMTTPLLVVVGDCDYAITEASMSETYLKWFPNSILETLSNSGHYPMQETPLSLVSMTERFMRQHNTLPRFV